MSLPAVPVPLALPFEFPLLSHPVIVHFAIVLPALILLIELFNILFKRRALSVTSLLLIITAVLVYGAAYFSGKTDGSEAYPLLSSEGQELLKTHKLLGGYLVYAMLLPLAMKLIAMSIGRTWGKGLLIVSLALVIGFIVKQGKDGGELVYTYGANVAAVTQLNEKLQSAQENYEDMNDTLTETQSELEACTARENGSIGHKVETGVQQAVESVKGLFADANASETEPSAVVEHNMSVTAPKEENNEIIAIDGNETNDTI